jgi:large conductance mechanosensitive channel
MISEFRTFLTRGNVLALAVAVIIGTAFAAIVGSLTDDLLMPVIGKVTGGLDFSAHFAPLGAIPASYTGDPTDYAALKKAGVPLLGYGAFITALLKFVILAFMIFLLVKAANRLMGSRIGEAEGPTAEVLLLIEIRDLLARDAERSGLNEESGVRTL